MSASGKSPIRPLAVGGALGFIIGFLIGWLVMGWLVWPVQYVGDAYSYELNAAEKMQYVAAVADSYNQTQQIQVVRQRFDTWMPEEKIGALAQLFAEDQTQGKMQEAERVADLAAELRRLEGWDPAVVSKVTSQVAAQYRQQGEVGKAQSVSLFASALGASVPVSTPAVAKPQAQIPLVGNIRTLLSLCGVLLLILVLVVVIAFLLGRRRPGRRPAGERREAEWTGTGPPPLRQWTSNFKLGMDNFDESFSIETPDGAFLGECGVGIAETLGQDAPKRVTAFEVWLFDKSDIRTVTKVLMSDFAYNNESLRSKLLPRGEKEPREAVLATPGATFTLETSSLVVAARILEMAYGDGMPAFGYFGNLTVSLVANLKPGADVSGGMPAPSGVGVAR